MKRTIRTWLSKNVTLETTNSNSVHRIRGGVISLTKEKLANASHLAVCLVFKKQNTKLLVLRDMEFIRTGNNWDGDTWDLRKDMSQYVDVGVEDFDKLEVEPRSYRRSRHNMSTTDVIKHVFTAYKNPPKGFEFFETHISYVDRKDAAVGLFYDSYLGSDVYVKMTPGRSHVSRAKTTTTKQVQKKTATKPTQKKTATKPTQKKTATKTKTKRN